MGHYKPRVRLRKPFRAAQDGGHKPLKADFPPTDKVEIDPHKVTIAQCVFVERELGYLVDALLTHFTLNILIT